MISSVSWCIHLCSVMKFRMASCTAFDLSSYFMFCQTASNSSTNGEGRETLSLFAPAVRSMLKHHSISGYSAEGLIRVLQKLFFVIRLT